MPLYTSVQRHLIFMENAKASAHNTSYMYDKRNKMPLKLFNCSWHKHRPKNYAIGNPVIAGI